MKTRIRTNGAIREWESIAARPSVPQAAWQQGFGGLQLQDAPSPLYKTQIRTRVCVATDGLKLAVWGQADGSAFQIRGEKILGGTDSAVSGSGVDLESAFQAQVPGKLKKILVQEGACVEAGARILLLEAMKMEFAITAPVAGLIGVIHFKEGDAIQPGARLLEFKPK